SYVLNCYQYVSTLIFFFLFFNPTATSYIYTLSLHDALPIWTRPRHRVPEFRAVPLENGEAEHPLRSRETETAAARAREARAGVQDRKSTRLNSSHRTISYAVFCLKKKKKK